MPPRTLLVAAAAALALAACSNGDGSTASVRPSSGSSPVSTAPSVPTSRPASRTTPAPPTTRRTPAPTSPRSSARRTATPRRPCPELTPARRPTFVDSFFGKGIYSDLKPVRAAGEDAVGIRLRTGYGYLDDITPYAQRAGTFDLAATVERDYRTCRHCVFALVDVSGDNIGELYLAQSGTLTLTSVDVDTGQFAGRIRDARLVQIKATGYYAWAGPVSGGRCLSIPDLAFDTRARSGAPCQDREDCPNAVLQSCRPPRCVTA